MSFPNRRSSDATSTARSDDSDASNRERAVRKHSRKKASGVRDPLRERVGGHRMRRSQNTNCGEFETASAGNEQLRSSSTSEYLSGLVLRTDSTAENGVLVC